VDNSNGNGTVWTLLALLASAVAVAGSLYLSLGMGLVACPLCYYQRTFAMCACGVLAVGLLGGAQRGSFLCLLALPLAAGGLGVAGWHVYLEAIGKLECPKGILEIGTAPQQSLAAFLVLTIPLLLGAIAGYRNPSGGPAPARTCLAIVVALVLGGLSAAGCVLGAQKSFKLPDEAFEGSATICRPPRGK